MGLYTERMNDIHCTNQNNERTCPTSFFTPITSCISHPHRNRDERGPGNSQLFVVSTSLCLSAHVKDRECSYDMCIVKKWPSSIWVCWLCEGIPWFWQGQNITYQLQSVSCLSLQRIFSLIFVFKLAKMNEKNCEIYCNNVKFGSFWNIVSNK